MKALWNIKNSKMMKVLIKSISFYIDNLKYKTNLYLTNIYFYFFLFISIYYKNYWSI